MIKKLFSLVLIATFFASPGVFAEADLSADPSQIKLEKAIAETERTKELLEIWKEHVKTLTQERNEAYQTIESLKNGMASGQVTPVAHFGEIETQAVPQAAMMTGNPSVMTDSSSSISSHVSTVGGSPSKQYEKEVEGYQQTIQDLHRQLDEVRAQAQKMQKEILEAGNDRTLIIKDKAEAITRIEDATKQIKSLQDENQKLTSLLNSRPAAATPTHSDSSELAFLQNSYNNQTVALKKSLEEKEETIRRADELQKKYVDLQAGLEKIKLQKVAAPAPQVPTGNPFENNYYKSQTVKLKAELQKLQQKLDTQNKAPIKSASDEELNQLKSGFENKIASQASQLDILKKNLEELLKAKDELKLKNEGLLKQIENFQSTQANALKTASSNTMLEGQLKNLQAENETLKDQIAQSKAENDHLKDELSQAKTSVTDASQNSTKELENAIAENARLVSQLKEAKEANQSDLLRSENDDFQKKNEILKAQVTDLKGSQEAMMRSFGRLKLQNRDTETENQKLKNDLDTAKTQIETLSANTSALDTLKSDLEKSSSEKDVFKFRNRAMTAQTRYLNKKVSDLKKKNDSLVSENSELQEKINTLKTQNQTLLDRAEKFAQNESEKKYLQNMYSDLSYKMKRRQIELDQMLKKFQALKADREKISSENTTIKNQSSSLAGEKEAALHQIAELGEEASRLKEENSKIKEASARLEENYSTLKASQAEYTKQIEYLKTQLAANDIDKEKINNLEREKEKMTAEASTMKKAMVDLEHEAQASEDKTTSLQSEITRLRDENATLERTSEDQSKTIDSLKENLKQSLSDIQNLKNNFQSYLESLVTSFEDRQKKSAPQSAAVVSDEKSAPSAPVAVDEVKN